MGFRVSNKMRSRRSTGCVFSFRGVSFQSFVPYCRSMLAVFLWAAVLMNIPATAVGKELVYSRYLVRMTLNRDTSIDVVETQQVLWSGYWNGLYRRYDLERGTDITIVSLSENGLEYRRGSVSRKGGYTVRRKGGAVDVKWRSRNPGDPPYHNDRTTFEIRYRLTGAVAQYRQRDVLYWNPIITKRENDIRLAGVTLELPEPTEQIEIEFYTKVPGAEWVIDEENPRLIHFSASNLSPRDRFEIKVSLPKGMLEENASLDNRYYYNYKPFVLPVAIIGGAVLWIWLWFLIGRDPEPDIVASSKVDDIMKTPPGIAGLLIDESFDDRDLTATILDLARRGYISVKETKEAKRFEPGSYKFTLVKVPGEGELAEFEQKVLDGLFGGTLTEGESVTTAKLKNKFYRHIPGIKKAAWDMVNKLGWFDVTPHHARKTFAIIGVLIIIPSVILAATQNPQFLFFAIWGSGFGGIPGFALVSAIKREGIKGCLKMFMLVPFVLIGMGVLIGFSYGMYRTSGWQFDLGVAGLIVGVMACIAAPAMARKSKAGADANRQFRALRDRLNGPYPFDRSLNLEHLLPWAVAFGATEHAIEKITEPGVAHVPYYEPYRGYTVGRSFGSTSSSSSAMSFSSMARGLSAMTSSVGSALSSSPSSSGTGGSRGGGSSGGGGGGGGGSGGGW